MGFWIALLLVIIVAVIAWPSEPRVDSALCALAALVTGCFLWFGIGVHVETVKTWVVVAVDALVTVFMVAACAGYLWQAWRR